jgi:tRNA A-37 threonylcarbamoyl transferase component Bud32
MKQALIDVDAGPFCWRLQPEFAQQLGPRGVRLDDWLRAGQATVVKQGPHRIVYRVALPGLTFYLKHNLTPDRRTWLRQFVRPSKARREYECALEAAARGIPTAVPVAWGQQRGLWSKGQSVLITRSLENTQPLHLFVYHQLPLLPARRQAQLRQRLADALGRLMARLHEAGIRHDDLHAGNLLLRVYADDRVELFLIDLTDVHFGSALSWRQSFNNLVVLNHWFAIQASRADRLRFWRSYVGARPVDSQVLAGPHDRRLLLWARRLEQVTWQSLHRHWKHRDRRCLVDNRYYRRLDASHAAGHAVTDLDARLAAALLADPDAPFRRTDAVVLKDSATSTVIEFTGHVNGQPRRLIYKRFCAKKKSAPWSSLVRTPPALRSWQHGQGFRERGLPTARPLLVLHRRRHGLSYEGYLLTEKIEHAEDLHEVFESLSTLAPAARRCLVRERINLAAQALRELHRRHLAHRDLKASNILLAKLGPQAHEEHTGPVPSLLPVPLAGIWFLDLVGVSVHDRLPKRRKLQNLARLNASFHDRPELTRSDRLRFLRHYLQWSLFGKQNWKSWWKAIAHATCAKLERNQGIGRKVA